MVSVLVDEAIAASLQYVLLNFDSRHGPLPWLQRVYSIILLLILRILSRVIVMSRGSNAPVKTDLKGWNKAHYFRGDKG